MRNACEVTLPRVLVAIAFHQSRQPLLRAVRSAISLPGVATSVVVLDSTPRALARLKLRNVPINACIRYRRARCSTAYAARNALISIANSMAKSYDWLVRLDADDTFVTDIDILGELGRKHFDKAAVLFGNNQVDKAGQIVGRNMPSAHLLNTSYLLRRLRKMASGDFSAELPSCNLVLRLPTKWRYPALKSAEDHALLAKVCVTAPTELGIGKRVPLVNYTLNGPTTKDNHLNNRYLSSRHRVLHMASKWLKK